MNTKKLRTFISVLILLLLFTTCGFAENGIRIDGQIGFDGVVLQGGAWRLTLNIENHSEEGHQRIYQHQYCKEYL